MSRGRVRHRDGWGESGSGRGLPCDDEYYLVRRGGPEQRTGALRRADGGGRREHDGFAGVYVRQGS